MHTDASVMVNDAARLNHSAKRAARIQHTLDHQAQLATKIPTAQAVYGPPEIQDLRLGVREGKIVLLVVTKLGISATEIPAAHARGMAEALKMLADQVDPPTEITPAADDATTAIDAA
jgi:hypothetical protein